MQHETQTQTRGDAGSTWLHTHAAQEALKRPPILSCRVVIQPTPHAVANEASHPLRGARCACAAARSVASYKPPRVVSSHHPPDVCQLVPRELTPPLLGAASGESLKILAAKFTNDPTSCITSKSCAPIQPTLLGKLATAHGSADNAVDNRVHFAFGRIAPIGHISPQSALTAKAKTGRTRIWM